MKRFLPYRAVVSARYRMLLQYRAAAFAGLVTQCFWGAIRLMIVAAFYAASTQAQPMSLPEVVVYIWLGQAFFGMLPWNIDEEFAQKVRDGSVAYDLLRPVDLYAFWYSHTLAYRTAPTTLRAIPLGLLAMLVVLVLYMNLHLAVYHAIPRYLETFEEKKRLEKAGWVDPPGGGFS